MQSVAQSEKRKPHCLSKAFLFVPHLVRPSLRPAYVSYVNKKDALGALFVMWQYFVVQVGLILSVLSDNDWLPNISVEETAAEANANDGASNNAGGNANENTIDTTITTTAKRPPPPPPPPPPPQRRMKDVTAQFGTLLIDSTTSPMLAETTLDTMLKQTTHGTALELTTASAVLVQAEGRSSPTLFWTSVVIVMVALLVTIVATSKALRLSGTTCESRHWLVAGMALNVMGILSCALNALSVGEIDGFHSSTVAVYMIFFVTRGSGWLALGSAGLCYPKTSMVATADTLVAIALFALMPSSFGLPIDSVVVVTMNACILWLLRRTHLKTILHFGHITKVATTNMHRQYPLLDSRLCEVHFGQKIGFGSAGQVFSGTYCGQPVAAKEFYSVAMGNGTLQELLRECSIWTEIGQHPNIVCIFGIATFLPSRVLLISELCSMSLCDVIVHDEKESIGGEKAFLESQSLSHALDEEELEINFLNTKEILRIAVHVCMAMHHLHGVHNIEHRDIKLSNIMLSLTRSGTMMGREFVAKLCDFGCAASLQVNRSDVGTVAYRPPESFDRSEVLHKQRTQCSSGDEVDEERTTAEQPEDSPTQFSDLAIRIPEQVSVPVLMDPKMRSSAHRRQRSFNIHKKRSFKSKRRLPNSRSISAQVVPEKTVELHERNHSRALSTATQAELQAMGISEALSTSVNIMADLDELEEPAPSDSTYRWDIYSFGVVLLSLVNHQHPWQGYSVKQISQAVAIGTYPQFKHSDTLVGRHVSSDRLENKAVNRQLTRIAVGCLAYSQTMRPATSSVLQDLTAAQSITGSATTTPNASPV